MRRILFNSAAGISLLLFLVAATSWIRSRTHADIFQSWPNPRITLISDERGVWFEWERKKRDSESIEDDDTDSESALFEYRRFDDSMYAFGNRHFIVGPDDVHLQCVGAKIWYLRNVPYVTRSGTYLLDPLVEIFIPHWIMLVTTFILPAGWMLQRFRHRVKPGHCATCGYDLRGSSGACPECGTAHAAQASAKEASR